MGSDRELQHLSLHWQFTDETVAKLNRWVDTWLNEYVIVAGIGVLVVGTHAAGMRPGK